MAAGTEVAGPSSYVGDVAMLVGRGFKQIVRPPSHSRRADAARRLARHALLLTAFAVIVIVALMVTFDATEIGWMPPRGTAALWPVRILTDFGRSNYVLAMLALLLVLIVLATPRLHGRAHAMMIGLGIRIQFILLAVLTSVLVGEVLKGVIGRGRPFVGGEANAFKFSHFSWVETYSSMPSGHATTCCALAFAVSALWPKLRVIMIIYALAIITSRLVLLAHHPSDVLAGVLTGVLGAMMVRYWFAARRLAFVIRDDGNIDALPSSPAALARAAFAS